MAKQAYSTNLGLSVTPEVSEKENSEVYSELLRIRNALKVLQSALDVYTGALGEVDESVWDQVSPAGYFRLQNISRIYLQATEDIAQYQLVNIYDVSGIAKARKASASAGYVARAYANTAVTSGNYVELILWGLLPSSGLTPGNDYWLSATAGFMSATAHAGTVQKVGWAVSANYLFFRPAFT
jgi:hypothetical protein